MRNLVTDTNIFLRLILNDIPDLADEAERTFKLAKTAKINLLVPQIVIFEIEFALNKYYGFSKEKIIDKLKTILNTPYLNVQNQNIFNTSLNLYKHSKLSLVDCFLESFAKENNAQVFTFDKNLKKIAKT